MTTTATFNPTKPYDLIHPMVHVKFTMPAGHYNLDSKPLTLTANFQSLQENGGGSWLRGKAIDEYGWWHTGLTLATDRLADTEFERVGYQHPDPAPFPVGVGFDWRHGMLRLTVPDDVALRLKAWRDGHWHEIRGVGAGYSDDARRGSWAHRALAYLHSVQCHTTDDLPFIQGESMESQRNEHGHLGSEAYGLLVSTCGVRSSFPTGGFHFEG